MKLSILFFTVCAALSLAQPPDGRRGPANPPDLTKLKAYLNLTDAQVQGLTTILQQERAALQPTMQDLRTQHKALRDQSTDATAVANARKTIDADLAQIAKTRTTFSEQAKNALTADQKTKLKTLEDAARIQGELHQAAALGLVTITGAPGFGPALDGHGGPGAPGAQAFGRRRPAPPAQ
jgi:Spy/CpxP family protein refolding chaperone